MIPGGKHWRPIETLIQIRLQLLHAITRLMSKRKPLKQHRRGFSIEAAARINEGRLLGKRGTAAQSARPIIRGVNLKRGLGIF
jgi:predicted RNA-binding protein YlqC (UPF0109 family)